jgi:hypothetical protein
MLIKLRCTHASTLPNGDTVAILVNPEETIEAHVTFHYPEIADLIQPGHQIVGDWVTASTAVD